MAAIYSTRRVTSLFFYCFIFILSSPFTAFFTVKNVYAEYIFTAPPREKPDRGKEMYQPLVDQLSIIMGEKVIYEHPRSWAAYGSNMRKGRYDIVFDGPHFNAWRQRHLKHIPLVSLPGTLDFYLVTSKQSVSIKKPRNLIGKKICGLPSPHLATGMIIAEFPSPYMQPEIFEVKGGQLKAYQAFKDGKCDATIFRKTTYKKLSNRERDSLKIIITTRSLPNQTISISKKLEKHREKILKFLTSDEGSRIANALLSRFSQNAMYFEKAKPKEFASVLNVLEGQVYGW